MINISKDNVIKSAKKLLPVIIGIIIGIFINSSSFSLNKIIENKFFKPVEVFSVDKVVKYFPLREGNRWEYEGYIRRQGAQEENPSKRRYKIIEEVIEKEEIADRILFTVNREEYIDDVLISSDNFGYFVISNKIYEFSKENFKKVKTAIDSFVHPRSNLSDEYQDILNELEQNKLEPSYEFPLSKGLLYGSMLALLRNDHNYAQYVEGETNYETDSVKNKQCFKIVNNYLCCESSKIFCRGLGVVEMEYKHNGTIDEYKVSLSRYLIKE